MARYDILSELILTEERTSPGGGTMTNVLTTAEQITPGALTAVLRMAEKRIAPWTTTARE